MTSIQFTLAVGRTRLRGRSLAAARLYLVDGGVTLQKAGSMAGGISHQAVQQAVVKVRAAAALDARHK